MMRQCTISCSNIPWRISLACRMNSFLGDCAFTFEFDECVMRPIHTGGSIGPQGKTAQGNRRLGGLREVISCVYSVCEMYCSIAERAG